MAKKKLEWEIGQDFLLRGIYSQEKFYRLVWLLNNNLACDFCRVTDLNLNLYKDGVSEHHAYVFENEEEEWRIILVQNKGSLGALIKESPAPLALLKASGDLSMEWINKIEDFAKESVEIQFYKPIILENQKNREVIIYDV